MKELLFNFFVRALDNIIMLVLFLVILTYDIVAFFRVKERVRILQVDLRFLQDSLSSLEKLIKDNERKQEEDQALLLKHLGIYYNNPPRQIVQKKNAKHRSN